MKVRNFLIGVGTGTAAAVITRLLIVHVGWWAAIAFVAVLVVAAVAVKALLRRTN